MKTKRRFFDAPPAKRCEASIRLKDGSMAQCGRSRKDGHLYCWQHVAARAQKGGA